MADLKPCPFCGGEAKYMNITEGIFISRFVTCTKCGIETKRNYMRKDQAIKAWNTRKPMEAVVAELEKASYQTESTFDEDGYCNDDSEEVVELHTAISIVRGKE